jgi:hypothetical protein
MALHDTSMPFIGTSMASTGSVVAFVDTDTGFTCNFKASVGTLTAFSKLQFSYVY